jgi:hypothetical protein
MLTDAVAHGLVMPQTGEADECDCPACSGRARKILLNVSSARAKSEIEEIMNSLSTMFLT